jgi:sporulation protein YlmC with PRC-barrel domain
MRAADLIGCEVRDAQGQVVGTVHDLRFRVRAGPDGTQACQLDALECGGVGLGHRLGYGEHAMRGPWPFPALFRYLARRSLAVPWSQVTAVSRPRIDISVPRDQLQPARGDRA